MHKKKFFILSTFTIVLFQLTGYPQTEHSFFNGYNNFVAADSNKLFLRIENFNFIKNNEYKSPFADGQTLPGYFLSPKLAYYPDGNIRIEAGIRMQKYSGITKYSETEPLFSVHYQPNKHTALIMGSINQNANHELTEPMFEPEQFFSAPAENGLQFLLDHNNFHLDSWISWEQFIFKNDPFQEHFTFGTTSRLRINSTASTNYLTIPAQLLITHKGGEIDLSDKPVQTTFCASSGINFTHNIQNSIIKYWSVETLTFYFKDNSNTKKLQYTNGYAFYPSILISSKHSNFMLGYWNARRFISLKGSPLFQTVSLNSAYFAQKRRELLTVKYDYMKKINHSILIGGKVDLYLDIKNKNQSCAAAVYVTFNENFFLKTIRR